MTIGSQRQNAQGFAQNVESLARKTIGIYHEKPMSDRVLVAISGIPGSGKTTLARSVVEKINEINGQTIAVMVPMDGFHYYRSRLATMPDPKTAIHRRGAAFTFDAARFYDLVKALREPLHNESKPIFAPSFDHALKDPVEDDIAISRQTRIVVFEGLYLSLDREPWSSAGRLMDELWFVEAARAVARARLIKRHVASRIVEDEAAAVHRVDSTDLLNADDILAHRLPVQEIICTI